MRLMPAMLLGMLAGCATAPPGPVQPPPLTDPSLRMQLLESGNDLRGSAIRTFGEAALAEARRGEFIVAKIYPGMRPPPPPGAGKDFRYPEPPTVLLVRSGGRWFRHTPAGGRVEVAADKAATIEAVLNNPAMWNEPTWGGMAGCTDAAGSLLWIRYGNHAEQVRRGRCGGAPWTERLIFAAVDAG